MEPQTPTPNAHGPEGGFFSDHPSPEASSERYKTYEVTPTAPDKKGERQETRERMTGAGAGDSDTHSPVVQVPQIQPTTDAVKVKKDDNGVPLVAADEDLIEMEWVRKAKAIVNETRSDPYTQEREVSKLQASYLQKRYGKEVKLPKDE